MCCEVDIRCRLGGGVNNIIWAEAEEKKEKEKIEGRENGNGIEYDSYIAEPCRWGRGGCEKNRKVQSSCTNPTQRYKLPGYTRTDQARRMKKMIQVKKEKGKE